MVRPALMAALVALSAGAAPAQGMLCGLRADIVAELESRFGETRRSYGFSRSQGVFEVFASDSGSWTILLTRPSGTSCLMASGEAFETEKPSAPEEET